MAHADPARHIANLRLETSAHHNAEHNNENTPTAETTISVHSPKPLRPPFKGSATSQETIRATPPMNIPTSSDPAVIVDYDASEASYIDHYMRNRQPSVSFNQDVKLDSGHSQSMSEPLEKPQRVRQRGRSLLHALSEDMAKRERAHSESDRTHYDRITGRHLPEFSSSPPREEARIGEGRFPLLQSTVDAMARESQTNLSNSLGLSSETTLSPNDSIITPRDDEEYLLSSPAPVSPATGAAFSYDEPKFKRTASQRWREGQNNNQSPQDFFARAGSLRKERMGSTTRLNRQDTSGSTRSLKSAASSYLRAFSVSSSTGDVTDNSPLACDAEGQTIGDDYVIGKKIGFGGFSIIKEVTQFQSGKQRKLAVKIVRRVIDGKSEAENEQAQAEFEHEVELWRFLHHPNILPLEAVYKLDEATFCFIPLNVGGTLFDLVRSNRQGVPTDLARNYTYQIASALRYLHLDARVVHRDIKLENILIDYKDDGNALIRLCDFGMAEWLSNDGLSGPPSPDINSSDRPPQKQIGPADTSTSAFAGGSLEYAAPEILRVAEALSDEALNERAIVSPAVDIWAMGVCIYSMIVGSRPFQNAFQPRVVMAILAGEWNRDTILTKGGNEVYEVTSGCLEMDDVRRWDINKIMNSRWLAELAAQDELNNQSDVAGAWRL